MPFTHTKSAYARHRGISHVPILRWIKNGKIPASCYEKTGKKVMIDPVLADAALAGNLDPTRKTKEEQQKPREKGPVPAKMLAMVSKEIENWEELDFNAAKTLVEAYKAATGKMKYQIEKGELLPRGRVEKMTFELGLANQDNIMRLSRMIAPIVAPMDNQHEIKQYLDKVFRDALKDIVGIIEKVKWTE